MTFESARIIAARAIRNGLASDELAAALTRAQELSHAIGADLPGQDRGLLAEFIAEVLVSAELAPTLNPHIIEAAARIGVELVCDAEVGAQAELALTVAMRPEAGSA